MSHKLEQSQYLQEQIEENELEKKERGEDEEEKNN